MMSMTSKIEEDFISKDNIKSGSDLLTDSGDGVNWQSSRERSVKGQMGVEEERDKYSKSLPSKLSQLTYLLMDEYKAEIGRDLTLELQPDPCLTQSGLTEALATNFNLLKDI